MLPYMHMVARRVQRVLPWLLCICVILSQHVVESRAFQVDDAVFANYVSDLEHVLSNDSFVDAVKDIGPWGSAQYGFHHKIHRGARTNFQMRTFNYAGGWFNWNFLLRSTYWCRNLQRVGGTFEGKVWHSDGSYWTCFDDLSSQGSIVYSLGSRDDTSFEQELAGLKPDIQVYAFDCTDISPESASLPAVLQGRFHKKQWCVDKEDYLFTPKPGEKLPFFLSAGRSYQYYSVGTVMANLGHKTSDIFIFKIDVEGWEWNVLPNVLASPSFRPNHLIMELHFAPWMDGPPGQQTPKTFIELFLLPLPKLAIGCTQLTT